MQLRDFDNGNEVDKKGKKEKKEKKEEVCLELAQTMKKDLDKETLRMQK